MKTFETFSDVEERCRIKKMFNFVRRVLLDCRECHFSENKVALVIAEARVGEYFSKFPIWFSKKKQFESLQIALREAHTNKQVIEQALLLIDELESYFGPAPVLSFSKNRE